MSRLPSAFRPSIEQLESREVPSVTLFATDNLPAAVAPPAVSLSGDGSLAPLSLQSERFVTHLYQDVLGRQPDAGGLTFWVTSLDNGTFTQGQVGIQFVASTEYRANLIFTYYQGILGRLPVTSEMGYFLGLFQAGLSQDEIRGMFYESEEFYNRVGRNPAAFVGQLYTQVLGRTATTGEVNFWVNVLNVTNGNRGLVADRFLTSTEHHQGEVRAAYTVFMHRPADPSGFSYWVGLLDTGMTVETVAAGFLASGEYYLRA